MPKYKLNGAQSRFNNDKQNFFYAQKSHTEAVCDFFDVMQISANYLLEN